MELLTVVLVLLVVGVALWAVNRHLASIVDPKILTIINVVVVLAVIWWLATIAGLVKYLSTIRI